METFAKFKVKTTWMWQKEGFVKSCHQNPEEAGGLDPQETAKDLRNSVPAGTEVSADAVRYIQNG